MAMVLYITSDVIIVHNLHVCDRMFPVSGNYYDKRQDEKYGDGLRSDA